MQYRKQIRAVVALAGVCVIGAWLWWHVDPRQVGSSSEALDRGESVADGSPVEMRSSTSSDSSEWAGRWVATRNNQDLSSVVNTFKVAADCLAYHDAASELSAMAADTRLDDLSKETLETLQNMDVSSARYVSLVQNLQGLCKGTDKNQLIQVFSNAVFDAALRNDPDAQTCFLLLGPSAWQGTGSIPEAKSEIGRYKEYTPAFTQKALERADPRVAAGALASYVASSMGHASWTDGLPKPDPVLTWRAARLASLRALPEQRARLEIELSEFGKKGVLSPSEITGADAWAAEVFEKEFSGQAPINIDVALPCFSSPDLYL